MMMPAGGSECGLDAEIALLNRLIEAEQGRLEAGGEAFLWADAISVVNKLDDAIKNKGPKALQECALSLRAVMENGRGAEQAALNLRKMIQEKARLLAMRSKKRATRPPKF